MLALKRTLRYNTCIVNNKAHTMHCNTLFYKVVAQKAQNAYFLLVSFDSHITQRNCMQYVTLCNINATMLAQALSALQAQHKASAVQDVTSDAVYKKLQTLFAKQAL